MEKPITPLEFIEQHHAIVDLKTFAKDLIDVYNKHSYFIRQKTCAVCDEIITQENYTRPNTVDFHTVCIKHAKNSTDINIVKVREALGYPPYKNYFE